MQLGAGTVWFCLSQCAIPFCTLSVVKCFKCGDKGHKCRECPLWERKVKRVARLKEGKVHQGERRPACPIREKAQEGEKRLRRVEEGEVACPVQREAQQG